MAASEPKFELPGKVEHYLGILSKVYKREGKNLKLSIIVNARINVIEGTYHDNWNGGIDGHSVILAIPQELFLSLLDSRAPLESEICKDINKLHRIGDYDSKRLTHSKRFELFLKGIKSPKWKTVSEILQKTARASETPFPRRTNATVVFAMVPHWQIH